MQLAGATFIKLLSFCAASLKREAPQRYMEEQNYVIDLIDGSCSMIVTASSETFTIFMDKQEALPISADHCHDRP